MIKRKSNSKQFIIIAIFLFLCSFSNISIAQSKSGIDNFSRFVTKNYNLPEELKYNCEWMYAVVRLKGDANNKVVSYEILNEAPEAFKRNFNFLIGYRFPKSIGINKHPVVFYFSIDNKEICKPKPGDFIYYSPNAVVETTVMYLQKILKDDPKTIIYPELIYQTFYAPQIKRSKE